MARPRAFDEDHVLDAATDRFWRHGYAATSVRDLGEATGLSAPSLYNAFGDKQGLFIRCLDRYLDGQMRARLAEHARASTGRAAIAGFLGQIVQRSLADPRGCLLVNTAMETAPHDAALAALVADRLGELEAFFRTALERGRRDGSVAPGPPAADVARLLVATVMGLRVLARSRPQPALLQGALRAALAHLDPPGTEPAR